SVPGGARGRALRARRRARPGGWRAHRQGLLPPDPAPPGRRGVPYPGRWGLADFRHRFGRPAEGMWLPEAAVNDDVLSVLAEEGVGFTLLAPSQAAEPVDTTQPYRWRHPTNPDLGVDIVFYDGGLSHDLAFSLS